jgi:hypothetical protein
MTEKTFSKWLVTTLRKQGWHVQRIETSTGSGVPDINCCKNGEEIWIETKCMDSIYPTLRPMQWAWMQQRIAHYGACWVLNLCKKDDRIYFYYLNEDTEHKKMKTGIKLLDYDACCDKKNFQI